jgi:hypothetical protein
MHEQKLTWAQAALFVAVALVGLLTIILGPESVVRSPDTPGYIAVGVDLQDGRLDEPHIRTVGYPLLMLAAGAIPEPGRGLVALQMVLHVMAVWAVLLLLRRLKVPFWLMAGVGGAAMLPPMTEYTFYAMTDSASQSILVLGFVSLMWYMLGGNRVGLVGAAVLFGAVSLVRPSFQFLGVGLAVVLGVMALRAHWFALPRRRLVTAALALIAGAVLIMGPVIAYNQRQFGVNGLSAFTGIILSTRTYTVLDRLPEDEPLRDLLITARDERMLRATPFSAQNYIFDAYPQMEGDLAEINDRLLRLNLRLIVNEPLNIIHVTALAFASYWLPGNTAVANSGSVLLQITWALLDFFLVGSFLMLNITLFALHGFALTLRPRPQQPEKAWHAPLMVTVLLIGVIALYNAVISSVVGVGLSRYREATELLMIVSIVLSGMLLQFYRSSSRIIWTNISSNER